uniref:Cysteine-rich venom protein n=1 Tax=Hemiscolopendra marginata TaxID=943146 RepID=A0A646QDZ6_9MYRI
MKLAIVYAIIAVVSAQVLLNALCCRMSERGVDDKMKAKLLDLHNKFRQKVANGQQPNQPSASNMKEVHWDDEIATKAQQIVERCVFQHSTYEERKTSKYPIVGENIYMGSYANPLDTAMNMWFDEVKDVNPSVLQRFNFNGPKVIGHYTQLVWAETEAIGCGYMKKADDGQAYVFCQYAPGGNYQDQSVYKQGPPASACPSGKSSKYPGLCS